MRALSSSELELTARPPTSPGSTAQETAQDGQGSGHRGGINPLVAPVGELGITRAEVDRVQPVRRELGDRGPRLLRLDRETAGGAQPAQQVVVDRDGR